MVTFGRLPIWLFFIQTDLFDYGFFVGSHDNSKLLWECMFILFFRCLLGCFLLWPAKFGFISNISLSDVCLLSAGFVTLPVVNMCTRNPAQCWLNLQPPANADSMSPTLISPSEIGSNGFTAAAAAATNNSGNATSTAFISTAASANTNTQGTSIQLRVSVRYKSVDVLPINAYIPLHTVSVSASSILNVQIHAITSTLSRECMQSFWKAAWGAWSEIIELSSRGDQFSFFCDLSINPPTSALR